VIIEPIAARSTVTRATASPTTPPRSDSLELPVALFDLDLVELVADLRGLRDVDALDHVPEQVVVRRELAGAVVDADEELRTVGVGARVGHCDRAERVLALHGLVGELVAGATGTTALGAATLDDELGHDAVEREPVVVTLPREHDEVVDRVRRELRVEIHHDRTAVGGDRDPVDLRSVDLLFGRFAGHAGLLTAWW
jgi:hypothetical protein